MNTSTGNYGMSSPAISAEKVKFVGDYLSELHSSLAYSNDRVKLLVERLSPILGNLDSQTPREKRDADFPLGNEILEMLDMTKSTNETLDHIISRLRI